MLFAVDSDGELKPKLLPILRTGATRLTDLARFAPQQSLDFAFVAKARFSANLMTPSAQDR